MINWKRKKKVKKDEYINLVFENKLNGPYTYKFPLQSYSNLAELLKGYKLSVEISQNVYILC